MVRYGVGGPIDGADSWTRELFGKRSCPTRRDSDAAANDGSFGGDTSILKVTDSATDGGGGNTETSALPDSTIDSPSGEDADAPTADDHVEGGCTGTLAECTGDLESGSSDAADTGADVLAADARVEGGCTGTLVQCTDAAGCISLTNDLHNCGSCGNDCAERAHTADGGASCSEGQCGYTCAAGYADCTDSGDGCGTALLGDDSANCGRCGHSCQGGQCDDGICQPLTLASQGIAYPSSLAVDATSVYWTESADISDINTNGSVKSASITGSSPASWSLIANNQLDPVGIAVTTQGIFWINAGIGGANPDGSLVWQPNGNTPAVPIGSPYACPLAMTVTDTNIYWVNCDQSTGDHNEPLLTVPLGNPTATPTVLVPSGIACIQAMASGSNSLYWIQSGCFAYSGQASALALSPLGTPANLLPSTVLSGIYPVRIAVSSAGVYFGYNPTGETGAGTIALAPLDGGRPTTIVAIANANGVAVDSVNIYWTDFNENAVLAAPIAGGNPVTLASDQTNPYDIVLDDTSVYWTNYSSTGLIMKVAKP
jgi:hypothetical protein